VTSWASGGGQKNNTAMAMNVYEDIERCMNGGWSDGLPVVPPYRALVDRMLDAMGLEGTQVVGEIPAQDLEIHAEQIAAIAVMAGCTFAHGRLLRSLSAALFDAAFNLSAVEVTTGGASATAIMSGPIVTELGFEHEANALGANNRANATVGRFAQMIRYFCGRGGGAVKSHGTIGHPGRLSFCIAEHPHTIWEPFHTQLGLPVGASVVSVLASEGPNSVNNHYCQNGTQVLETIADCLAHLGMTNYYYHSGNVIVVLAPEHMRLVSAEFTRAMAREFLYTSACRPTDELIRLARVPRQPHPDGRGMPIAPGTTRSPLAGEEHLYFIETGARGGKFSAVIPGWVAGTKIVARVID
jgi:hypothetical protein